MTTAASIKPTWAGTAAILIGCGVAFFANLDATGSYAAARTASLILLAALAASVLLDWRRGLRNLIRVDLFALLALYFLLYFEFLFPQPNFEAWSIADDVRFSINLTLLGFAALAVGRHIRLPLAHALDFVAEVRLRPGDYVWMLIGAFLLANLHMWLSVGFDPVRWFEGLLEPRFSRPWARGQYGDASALVSELELLGYVIPPLAGLIFARRKEYAAAVLGLVLALFLVQCFVAFASGTRNVFAVFIAGFIGGYFIVQKELKIRNLVIAGAVAGLVFVVFAKYMLEFRNIGLGRFIEEERYRPAYRNFQDQYLGGHQEAAETYFVDFNLYSISLLVAVFPEVYGHLGWNLPYVALTKPIPRFLWPSKPTDLNVGMEEALGIKGMTIAATFVGEAYIAFSLGGVIVAGILLGAFCGWWNHLAAHLHAPLSLAVYTSGFFTLLITMRSLMFFTTSLLPSIALLVFARILYVLQRSS